MLKTDLSTVICVNVELLIGSRNSYVQINSVINVMCIILNFLLVQYLVIVHFVCKTFSLLCYAKCKNLKIISE